MPSSPLKPCKHPGCAKLSRTGRCDSHLTKTAQTRDYDLRRGSAASRGYGHKWRTARLDYLKAHPLCVACDALGVIKGATEVDHITPHKGDQKLFWSRSNWQSMCKSCHSAKTVLEDGGFGR